MKQPALTILDFQSRASEPPYDVKQSGNEPPRWALDQAAVQGHHHDEGRPLHDRAWQLVRATQAQPDESHDQFDDPDEGGEG